MTRAELLNIAIGVVFTFFALSLIVSAINETINRMLAVRSKQLWRALRRMLDDPTTRPKDDRSGLLLNLHQAVTYIARPTGEALQAKSAPADRFHRAKVRQARRETRPRVGVEMTDRFYKTRTIQSMEVRTNPTKMTKIHHIPPPVFSQGLIETIAAWSNEAVSTARTGLSAYEATTSSIEAFLADPSVPDGLRRQLRVFWAEANGDVQKFSEAIGGWFDSQMTRLSAVYKSQARIVLGVIGLFVVVGGFAVGLRTDSLALVTDLQHDENLRTVLASAANSAVQADLNAEGCKPADPTSTSAPVPPSRPPATTSTTAVTAGCQLQGLTRLKEFDLAIHSDPKAVDGNPKTSHSGSTTGTSEYKPAPEASVGDRLRFLGQHLRALLGVALTTLAIAFGSSFWYTILQRLVGLRGGGNTSPQPT